MALLGGHTVQDQEIKFGYAVTGEIDPRGSWPTPGARPGDVLILTKALGTGIIATALKFGRAPRTRGRGRDRVDDDAEPGGRRGARAPARRRGARLHRHHRLRPDRPRLGDGGRERLLARDRGRRRAAARRRARARSAATFPAAAGPTGSTSAPRVAIAPACRRRPSPTCCSTRRRPAGCSSRCDRTPPTARCARAAGDRRRGRASSATCAPAAVR